MNLPYQLIHLTTVAIAAVLWIGTAGPVRAQSLTPHAHSASANTELRVLSLGWNQPTLEQLIRDRKSLEELPLDGSVISIRLKPALTKIHAELATPLSSAHSRLPWQSTWFAEAMNQLQQMTVGTGQDCWIGIHANPGDVSFLDDQGWEAIVEHWRIAARMTKAGGLRGLWFDPEAYSLPHSQFQAATFLRKDKSVSFDALADAARRRGSEVMRAIQTEHPRIEVASCFWMSFLLRDRLMMGPTPLDDQGNRKIDFQWRLAGHQYGLLPAFMTGMLEAADDSIVFYDGCEDAYWFESESAFTVHADQVRRRGRMLIDEDVRPKYDAKIRLAFPVFVDLSGKNLIPRWTLSPDCEDRGKVFQEQLRRAAEASDEMVWLYSERGTWWPEPKETALWKNKDVYPLWNERIPNCLDSIRLIKSMTQNTTTPGEAPPHRDASPQPADTSPPIGPTPTDEQSLAEVPWSKVQAESKKIAIAPEHITITGPSGGAAVAEFPVVVGKPTRVSVRLEQSGAGMPRLMVQFLDDTGELIEPVRQMPASPSTTLLYAYPDAKSRHIEMTLVAPKRAIKAQVHCLVTDMASPQDQVRFHFQSSNHGD